MTYPRLHMHIPNAQLCNALTVPALPLALALTHALTLTRASRVLLKAHSDVLATTRISIHGSEVLGKIFNATIQVKYDRIQRDHVHTKPLHPSVWSESCVQHLVDPHGLSTTGKAWVDGGCRHLIELAAGRPGWVLLSAHALFCSLR